MRSPAALKEEGRHEAEMLDYEGSSATAARSTSSDLFFLRSARPKQVVSNMCVSRSLLWGVVDVLCRERAGLWVRRVQLQMDG